MPRTRIPRIARRAAAALLPLAAVACDGSLEAHSELGQQVYERSVGGLACADCHGESPEPRANPDWLPAGHPLGGVFARDGLWGGRFEGENAVLDASLYCAARFQYDMLDEVLADGGGRDFDGVPLTSDERGALVRYLARFDGPGDPVDTRRDDDVEAVFELAGDPDEGELVWAAACAVCHGANGEGDLGPPLTGDDSVDPFTFADYVRQGSDFGSPDTWMPHFKADRLSAQQLADLLARWAE